MNLTAAALIEKISRTKPETSDFYGFIFFTILFILLIKFS